MPSRFTTCRGAFVLTLLGALGLGGCTTPPESASVASPSTYAVMQVFKPRGAVQCGDRGVAPEAMQAELERAGARVASARCASDGRMYPAVCGGATGEINLFEINAADAERARSLGFAPLADLRGEAEPVPCR